MPRIITIISGKGGVNKTTSTIHIASHLAAMGFKTLIVDADYSQANATNNLLGPIWNANRHVKGIGALVSKGENIDNVIYASGRENLFILPSEKRDENARNYNLESTIKDMGLEGYSFFKDAFAQSEKVKEMNFVLFDLGPSLGTVTVSSLIGSDYALIPVCTEFFSMESILDTKDAIEKVQKANPHLKLLGMFISKEDRRLKTTRDAINKLHQLSIDNQIHFFNTKIPIFNKFTFLAQDQQTIYDITTAGSRGHAEYVELTEEILERIKYIETAEVANQEMSL